MPNQMIALQARAPQTDILGSSIARSAQMINMMRQQDAAERQAAAAAQAAQIAAAQELRAAAKEGRDIQEAKIKLVSDAGKIFRDSLASWVPFGDTAAAQRLRDMTVALVPELKDVIPTAEALSTDRNLYNQAYMTAEQLANKRFGTATTSTQVDPRTNKIIAVNAAGLPEASFAQPVPDISQPLSGGAPTPGGAAPAGGLRPTRGANTTPADLKAQMAPVTPDRIEAAAQAAARGARATDPIFDGLNDDQFRQMQMRADEIRAGGASMKPASFGGAAQPDLGAIVENMMQTGVVSQTDFEAMRAAAPGKDTQLAEILRANNIRIMPDETAAGGMRSAVYRPEEGAPAMLEAQYNPNAYQTAQGKPPLQSPAPGTTIVPLKRLGSEKRVEAQGAAEGQAEAERVKSRADQRRAAENFFRVVGVKPNSKQDPVADLIKRSTSGAVEAIGAELVGGLPESIGGGATEGAQAIGELQTIAAKLTNDLLGGKLGTGISNEDRNMIQRLVGDIGNPYIAAGKRLASWRRVKQIQASYLGGGSTTPTKRVIRTGTFNGRRVVKYSDGTIDYAD